MNDPRTDSQTATDYLEQLRQTGPDRLGRFGGDVLAALAYPFRSVPRAILALVLAGLTFVVLILAAQPTAIINTLARNPAYVINSPYIEQMFVFNFSGTVATYGWTPIVLNVVYAVLTGIALTNMVAQLRMLRVNSLSNIGGIIPGLFAAGCASCGPGLFALLGFTGAVSFIPFQGTVLRLAGIGLFLFFLGLAGDPRECRIQ